MKHVTSLLIILGLTIGFLSCKKTINCQTPVIKNVYFYSTISTKIVPDSSASLVKYRKGSKFSQVSEVFPKINLIKDGFNKYMEFPLKGEETYDYDWEITLKPSNKIYLLSEIEHESATSKTHQCTNTVTYKVNGDTVTVPGNPYSATPNFVSDVRIEYW